MKKDYIYHDRGQYGLLQNATRIGNFMMADKGFVPIERVLPEQRFAHQPIFRRPPEEPEILLPAYYSVPYRTEGDLTPRRDELLFYCYSRLIRRKKNFVGDYIFKTKRHTFLPIRVVENLDTRGKYLENKLLKYLKLYSEDDFASQGTIFTEDEIVDLPKYFLVNVDLRDPNNSDGFHDIPFYDWIPVGDTIFILERKSWLTQWGQWKPETKFRSAQFKDKRTLINMTDAQSVPHAFEEVRDGELEDWTYPRSFELVYKDSQYNLVTNLHWIYKVNVFQRATYSSASPEGPWGITSKFAPLPGDIQRPQSETERQVAQQFSDYLYQTLSSLELSQWNAGPFVASEFLDGVYHRLFAEAFIDKFGVGYSINNIENINSWETFISPGDKKKDVNTKIFTFELHPAPNFEKGKKLGLDTWWFNNDENYGSWGNCRIKKEDGKFKIMDMLRFWERDERNERDELVARRFGSNLYFHTQKYGVLNTPVFPVNKISDTQFSIGEGTGYLWNYALEPTVQYEGNNDEQVEVFYPGNPSVGIGDIPCPEGYFNVGVYTVDRDGQLKVYYGTPLYENTPGFNGSVGQVIDLCSPPLPPFNEEILVTIAVVYKSVPNMPPGWPSIFKIWSLERSNDWTFWRPRTGYAFYQ